MPTKVFLLIANLSAMFICCIAGPMPALSHSHLSQHLTVSFYWAILARQEARAGRI